MYEIIAAVIATIIYIWFDYRAWQKKQVCNVEPQKPRRIIDDHWDLLDGSCTCHCGNPPCSYCVDTFDCPECKERRYALDSEEVNGDFICVDCYGEICYKLTRKQNWMVYGTMAAIWLIIIAVGLFIYFKVF